MICKQTENDGGSKLLDDFWTPIINAIYNWGQNKDNKICAG